MAAPRFSILTPVFDTPADVLAAMLDSVRTQRYGNWELCLVNDCSTEPHVAAMLAEAERRDPRVRVAHREANGGIVAASNDALAMARGEFVALLDHDDELHPKALSAGRRGARRGARGRLRLHRRRQDRPHRPPLLPLLQARLVAGADAHPDVHLPPQRSAPQPGRGGRRLRPRLRGLPGLGSGAEGDRAGAAGTARARVLYHWRTLESSAAGGGEEAKPWAFDAGTRAIQAHCDRTGVPADGGAR